MHQIHPWSSGIADVNALADVAELLHDIVNF